MKAVQFFHTVASIVAKVADQPLREVDPEANVLGWFDSGADETDQVLAATECANEILFENGYSVDD
jgi:hypothetical protein